MFDVVILPEVLFVEEIIMGDDYIDNLTEDEKLAFLSIFCILVRADGYIESEEVDFLKMMARRYKIDDSVVVNIIKESEYVNLDTVAQRIIGRSHALELIKELCFVANVDESLNDNEVNTILNIAQKLNIEGEKVVMINRWVLDNLALDKTGMIILEKNNA